MGMLADGRWQDEDRVIEDGAYVRPASPLRSAHKRETVHAIAQEPGRYWLIASSSCPWSHRATIARRLKGLDDLVPMHMVHGPRLQGYAIAGGESWNVPGTAQRICHLHELYTLDDEHYTGRVTVPVLWDSRNLAIVSNESADIVQAFDAVATGEAPDFTLRPTELSAEIDAANDWIYQALNNAVYRAGFAQSQQAYDDAVALVFQTLDRLEKRLASSRYYFGNTLTETDIRLFPTLVRFDAIYNILFKCSLRRLVDYPALWAYARDLYNWRGIAETVDFQAMRNASYLADTSDPHPLVAIAPEADWGSAHEREKIADAHLALRTGALQVVNPKTLLPATGSSR